MYCCCIIYLRQNWQRCKKSWPLNCIKLQLFIIINSTSKQRLTRPSSIISDQCFFRPNQIIKLSGGEKGEIICMQFMRRSNRNFNNPPPCPQDKPRHLSMFCAQMGNLTDKAVPGVGSRSLPGWGGENWTWPFLFILIYFIFFLICIYFQAPESLTAINTCLDKMELIKGRYIAFVSDIGVQKRRERLNFSNLRL